jgi:RNA polymerase sigma-70 factor (ECF subfamily)
MLRNRTEAEDITQDIFLRVWRALPGYSGRAALSTWIYAISRNTCLSKLRQRHPQLSLDNPDSEHAAAIEQLAAPSTDDSAVVSVTQMLESLPERYRQVVTLFYMEDKSCEQTAIALGLPVGTVKALLHRARRRMIDLVNAQSRGP